MKLSEKEMQLLALVDSERSGREVAQLFEKETKRSISYGTLYTTFRRLKEEGLVNARDADDEDGRVRFFKITGAGQRALRCQREHYSTLAVFGLPQGA